MNKTDAEIIKALECCVNDVAHCFECPYNDNAECNFILIRNSFSYINRLKAENERLNKEVDRLSQCVMYHDGQIADAIKEFAEKITEIFMRYAHLHAYAEGARKDFIEAGDGTNLEMQSVWDAFTLKKNGMAEYEGMGRLQNNIETIANERLLTELEKDFHLLVKEMTGNEGKE